MACGALWTIAKGIRIGDVILSPDGSGRYHVAELTGEYYYTPDDGALPHRRPVMWSNIFIDRADMSEALRHATGSIGTIGNVTAHATEFDHTLGLRAG